MPHPAAAPGRYRVWGIVSIAALLAVLLNMSLTFWGGSQRYVFFDLDIYRKALTAVASGTTETYAALPYPPIAFAALWFLHVLPPVLGDQVWTALSIALILVVSLVLAIRMMEARKRDWRAERWMLILLATIAALLVVISSPTRSQITNGQMSLVVMALSFVDLSGVLPRRYRGVLVGVAGALKLTPLVFVVYYLVTGQRRNAAVATGSFAITTAIGWAMFPSASLQFWTHVGGSEQFGDPARRDNLSIHSLLTRISPELGAQSWLWLLLGVVVIVSALWRARVHFQRGEAMESFLTVGAAATVVAPIAWPHYFIWLPVIGIWLWFTGGTRAKVVGGLVYLVYSQAGIAAILDRLIAVNPRFISVVDVLVLIPMAIGILGLPHRLRPRPNPATSAATAAGPAAAS